MMQRTAGWEHRLNELFVAARKRAFVWGEHDCFLWAADAVLALTGHDPVADWRGRYTDELTALRTLRDYLGRPESLRDAADLLAERIAAEIGANEASLAFARRGDVALVDGAAHRTFAVVAPNGRTLAAVTPEGLARLPLDAGLRFWAVG